MHRRCDQPPRRSRAPALSSASCERGFGILVDAQALLRAFLATSWLSELHCCNRPRGVTVSTLDSESSDRGSNPREALSFATARCTRSSPGGSVSCLCAGKPQGEACGKDSGTISASGGCERKGLQGRRRKCGGQGAAGMEPRAPTQQSRTKTVIPAQCKPHVG